MRTSSSFSKISVLFISFLTSVSFIGAGQLSVGTKVIYPGEDDQPGGEKDTGVVFNAGTYGENPNTSSDFSSSTESDTLAGMANEGNYEELLSALGERNDSIAEYYRVLALWHTGKEEKALQLGSELVNCQKLSDEMKNELIRLLEIDPEDLAPDDED